MGQRESIPESDDESTNRGQCLCLLTAMASEYLESPELGYLDWNAAELSKAEKEKIGASDKRQKASSCQDASSMMLPTPAKAGCRIREAYLLRLGIARPSHVHDRRCPPRCPRCHRPRKRQAADYLELVVEETAKGMPASAPSTSSTSAAASVPLAPPFWAAQTDCGADMMSGSDRQARMKFLQKLSYERVWLPRVHRPPSHQTVIIFDWDDTLLCTSFLHRLQGPVPLAVNRILKLMQDVVITLLELSLIHGQTFIITNASNGWVEHSAAEHLPGLGPVLQRVRVVSARSRYEAEYPNEVARWKAEAFLEVQRHLDSQVITNLVSLGDSDLEMEATQAMARQFQQATIKTVKFHQFPSPEELLKQQELVCKSFVKIVGNARDLKVWLQAPHNRTPLGRSLDKGTAPTISPHKDAHTLD